MWKNTYCKNLNVYKKPVLDPVKNDSESQHCFELVSIDRSETEKKITRIFVTPKKTMPDILHYR